MPKLRLETAMAYSDGGGFVAGDIIDATDEEAARFLAAGLAVRADDAATCCGSVSGGRSAPPEPEPAEPPEPEPAPARGRKKGADGGLISMGAQPFLPEPTVETAPAEEPVTLAEAKAHLRVEVSNDDTLISALIVAARELWERSTSRTLVETAYAWQPPRFPPDGGVLFLPRHPVLTVDSVEYTPPGTGAVLTAFADFALSASDPASVFCLPGSTWPETNGLMGSGVRIEFTAGYADASEVPQLYKQALLMLVGGWYDVREEVTDGGRLRSAPASIAASRIMELARVVVWS